MVKIIIGISLNPNEQQYHKGYPQVAQVAIQQGKFLGNNFKRLTKNKALVPIAYRDKGSTAIISKYKAVVDLPGIFVRGLITWLIWLLFTWYPLPDLGIVYHALFKQ